VIWHGPMVDHVGGLKETGGSAGHGDRPKQTVREPTGWGRQAGGGPLRLSGDVTSAERVPQGGGQKKTANLKGGKNPGSAHLNKKWAGGPGPGVPRGREGLVSWWGGRGQGVTREKCGFPGGTELGNEMARQKGKKGPKNRSEKAGKS